MNELCTLQDDVPSFPDDQVRCLWLPGSDRRYQLGVHARLYVCHGANSVTLLPDCLPQYWSKFDHRSVVMRCVQLMHVQGHNSYQAVLPTLLCWHAWGSFKLEFTQISQQGRSYQATQLMQAFGILQEELGRPIAEVFSSISERPIAAASLGQVYKAVLRETSEAVAVKVQRPGVEPVIFKDLFIFRSIARLVNRWAC